jgi:nucleoredoxin
VNKKNLTAKCGYMFRVRPVLRGEAGAREAQLDASVTEGGTSVPFSPASDVVGARQGRGGAGSAGPSALLKLFRDLPRDALLAKGGRGTAPLAGAFAGADLVFLYASAHWCPPCRKYTPQLVRFYHEARRIHKADPQRTKAVEIVFVSADRDANEFKNYFATMPWLAVPFEAEARERIMAWMKVSGVPQLMCLDGRSGKVLEKNSVGRALDLERFSKYVK